MTVRKIRMEATREHEFAAPDKRHRLVISYSNLETVVHLSNQEVDILRTVVAEYNSVTRQTVEM